jgi:hypothetical protein
MNIGLTGWGRMLAAILASVPKMHGTPFGKRPIPGSHERYIHYASQGTVHHSGRRSHDRMLRRSGQISARQQRIERKARQRFSR